MTQDTRQRLHDVIDRLNGEQLYIARRTLEAVQAGGTEAARAVFKEFQPDYTEDPREPENNFRAH